MQCHAHIVCVHLLSVCMCLAHTWILALASKCQSWNPAACVAASRCANIEVLWGSCVHQCPENSFQVLRNTVDASFPTHTLHCNKSPWIRFCDLHRQFVAPHPRASARAVVVTRCRGGCCLHCLLCSFTFH